MFLPIEPQPDCVSAWIVATRTVFGKPYHEAHNVIIGVKDPVVRTSRADPVVNKIDHFLSANDTSVFQLANTIFPQDIYNRWGAPEFFDVFHEKLLPKLRKSQKWSGYYFERMTAYQTRFRDPVETINPLWEIVERLNNPENRALNKYELAIFDPERDVDLSPYAGQCLSHLSFKVHGVGERRQLALTALYRNHHYIKKLLGNLIGLGRLLAFVAEQSKLERGALTVVSTHAEADDWEPVGDVEALLEQCVALNELCA